MAIVKSFPKEYILRKRGSLATFQAPAKGWYIIEHHGQDADGLEVYEVFSNLFATKGEAVRAYQDMMRKGVLHA